MAPTKRYHKTITFTDKCKVLEALGKGLSIRRVSEKFSVPKSTVADVKKNKDKIRHFVSRSFHGVGKIHFIIHTLIINAKILSKVKKGDA
jgi:hypothetical protein